MRRIAVAVLVFVLTLGPIAPWLGWAQARDKGANSRVATQTADASLVKGKYIVKLRGLDRDPGVVANELAKLYGFGVVHVYSSALRGFSASIPDEALPLLKRSNLIETVDPVELVYPAAQEVFIGDLRVEVAPPAKNAQADIAGNGGPIDVDVAVIDSGIDNGHPDLNYFRGVGFPPSNATVDCAHANNQPGVDAVGHGTVVAGIAAARDNDKATVGVAPGARLWSVKVLDDDGHFGDTSGLVCAVDYVTSHADEIEVVNMSVGTNPAASSVDDGNCGNTSGDLLHQAICNSVNNFGLTYVVAAMNNCTDASKVAPAAYDEVITVSAMVDSDGLAGGYGPNLSPASGFCSGTASPWQDDTFAPFSNYGADIDLAAPGAYIKSTASNGGTAIRTGTSMAAPYVAGAAALYKAAHPGATPAQVRAALIAEREQVALPGDPDGINEGVLNLNDGAPWADTSPPTLSLSLTESDPDSHVDGTTLWYNNKSGNSGAFTVTANAADAQSGIQQVDFPSLFGEGGTDSTAPYSETYTWNDSHSASGAKTVTALNPPGYTASATFTVQPDKADPSVAVTAPTAGQTVGGTVAVTVAASDAGAGVADVALRWCPGSSACGANQGTAVGSDATAPYQVNWDTTGLADGTYKLVARATDNVGNQQDSATVSVTVSNGSLLLAGERGAAKPAETPDATANGTASDNGTAAKDGGKKSRADHHRCADGKASKAGKAHAAKGQLKAGKQHDAKRACKGGR